MALDLKSVELFVRVASVGAIGKAGEEFGLSRTAATQRIQALETDVGVQLFHRTTRKLSLTGDGETFLEHAKRILESVDEALSDTQKNPGAIKGELRVASSSSFGRKHIAPYVSEFLAAHPNLSIQLNLSDSIVDIVGSSFDLSIRLGELAPSSLKARRLASSPRIIVAAPSYLSGTEVPRQPMDLIAHNCLMRGDVRTWRLSTANGSIKDYKVAGNFASDSAEAITEATLSGLGIARKCKWEIREHLDAGTLVQVLEDCTVMPEWSVFAVRSPSRLVPAKVKLFTEFLKTKLQSEPSLA